MRVIPRGALVIGEWRELPVLYYFRHVDGLRPDLTFQPYSHPSHLAAVRVWQTSHDLARRPIVFLTMPPALRRHVVRADSVELGRGQWIFIVRHPMIDLPPRGAGAS
jgi:hypothetical protein